MLGLLAGRLHEVADSAVFLAVEVREALKGLTCQIRRYRWGVGCYLAIKFSTWLATRPRVPTPGESGRQKHLDGAKDVQKSRRGTQALLCW